MNARRLIFILIAGILGTVVCVANSYAYEYYEDTNAFGKLTRGISNIVTSPIEVPRNVVVQSKESNIIYGMTIGLGKGLVKTLFRFGAGVVETLTFPFNFPDEFKDPIIQPEYVWEEWE